MATAKGNEPQNENLRFYEKLRSVPAGALKAIAAGRLKGMSDVNPVWRIKAMTEAFGPAGIGWKYEITRQWQEQYGDEVKSFTNINLFIKVDGQWSDAIPGTGGATIVENSRNGLYVNDEGYKMSLTDALSVAMKSLGVAADVYFSKDKTQVFDTKYEQQAYAATTQQTQSVQPVNAQQTRPAAAPGQQDLLQTALAKVSHCADVNDLISVWGQFPSLQGDKHFRDAWAAKRGELEKRQ